MEESHPIDVGENLLNEEAPHGTPQPAQAKKDVIFRTPVILGVEDIQSHYDKRKIVYKKDALLHESAVPEVCQHLPVSMVIDLPTENVSQYIDQFLLWLHLLPDEQLVDRLQQYIVNTL